MEFKVKPLKVFGDSFSTFWSQQKALLIIIAAPFLAVVCAAVVCGGAFFLFGSGWFLAAVAALACLPVIYANYSMQLSWYRYMFKLEDQPQWFRTDLGRHLRLFWAGLKSIAFACGPFALVGLIYLVVQGSAGAVAITFIAGAIALAWAIFATLRLSLYSPAVALDEPVTLRRAFNETKGNFWRLFGLAFLIVLLNIPVQILEKMVGMAFYSSVGLLVTALAVIVYFALLWVIYGVRFASSAEVYRAWLMSKTEPPASPLEAN